jgi:hypothetical protein
VMTTLRAGLPSLDMIRLRRLIFRQHFSKPAPWSSTTDPFA